MTHFRVMLRLNIIPGKADEFEETWLKIGETVTNHPANIGQWLLHSSEEDNAYFIVSDWLDEPSFRAFENSDQHVEHRQKLHPFRNGGSMTTMRFVYSLPGRAA